MPQETSTSDPSVSLNQLIVNGPLKIEYNQSIIPPGSLEYLNLDIPREENLFLDTYNELLIEPQTAHEFLKLAYTIRKLILESPTFYVQANTDYKLKFSWPYHEGHLSNKVKYPQFRGFDQTAISTNKDKFLKSEIARLFKQGYRVKEVLDIANNKSGAVHFSKKLKPKEKLIRDTVFQDITKISMYQNQIKTPLHLCLDQIRHAVSLLSLIDSTLSTQF